ncbi:hypothetical protein R1sor_026058 [Riccia sorocarpa]|uniref:Reverse transcriptase domain-containing protein n=1 Tax=Riccia sorocarpa TaxID=122646 RepID=A0ABD3GAD9_9MARC
MAPFNPASVAPHDQVISDHVPISFLCQLSKQGSDTCKPKSYYKMDVRILNRPGVLQKVQSAWDNHPPDAGNPQRKFQLAWIRVREVLKQESQKANEENRTSYDAVNELRLLRSLFRSLSGPDFSEETLARIRQLEQVKARNARETIKSLYLHDGSKTSDRTLIMSEVQDFMSTLYTAETTSPEREEERANALNCIHAKVTVAQDRAISIKPTPAEVDTIAHLMKKEKSPGLDGVTIEVLLASWNFVRGDCLEMIEHFWEEGKLIKGTRTAVIKLNIPKNQEVEYLKNWRPLSIMILSYKIIAKILAERLKKLMPGLDFSSLIPVKRGIRQGCPLAPYLFALCIQVLMSMLNAELLTRTIRGLRINDDEQLFHQIFADDTGLFVQMERHIFENTMSTLRRFELASGAKLNLGKTLVLPLCTDNPVPTWLQQSQCTIALPFDRFRYLGILAGNNVLEEEILQQLQENYQKKLEHMANRLLTWPEKVLLAQSVLRALPNFILMAIGLSAKGTHALEKITADFLWERDTTGKKKRPLIAWGTFSRRKIHGGLGWPNMNHIASAFLLKNLSKLILAKNEDWIKVANAIIAFKLEKSKKTMEVRN